MSAFELPSSGPGGGLFDAYAYIRDEKATNTGGGAFTNGAWRTRDLNTEVFDFGGIVSLATNQFTLQAGTYFIRASAPAYLCSTHRVRLRNITAGTTAAVGTSAYNTTSTNDGTSRSTLMARVTIAVETAFEIQHMCATTNAAATGFGVASNLDSLVEVYTEVEIWREM